MTEKKYILEVENIKKYYLLKKSFLKRSNIYAKSVDGVSFSIEKGKALGLVGESGCGKSTVAKTILNLIEPTEGRVVFEENVLYDTKNNVRMNKKDLSKLRKNMQMIFQDPYSSLDPKMTVREIIMEGIETHKIANKVEGVKKVEELLMLCGIDKNYINRYPHEFSGGQRQRIGIARVLALNPKFIICDEPTAALDVSIQSQILNLMLDLKEKFNLTYLFISHNLNIVKFFCDDIAVMYLGNIVEKSSSEEIYNNPLHPYTKSLIASIPKKHPLEIKNRLKLKKDIDDSDIYLDGCKFSNRCPYSSEICFEKSPTNIEVKKNHFVCCHKFNK